MKFSKSCDAGRTGWIYASSTFSGLSVEPGLWESLDDG